MIRFLVAALHRLHNKIQGIVGRALRLLENLQLAVDQGFKFIFGHFLTFLVTRVIGGAGAWNRPAPQFA